MVICDIVGAHVTLGDFNGDDETFVKWRTTTTPDYGRRPMLDEAILGLGLSRRPFQLVDLDSLGESGGPTYHTEMQTILRLPLWMPFFLLMIYPTSRAWRGPIRRLRRRRRNQCMECGYILSGNTSGICPECGTPIPDEVKEQLATDPPKR